MILFSRRRFLFLLLLSQLYFFTSCDSNRYYEENVTIGKATWNTENRVKFNVSINEIQSSYTLYINVRNTGEYPFSNLFLFLKTTFPDGRVAKDTIECPIADNKGKWLGSGITDIKFNRLLFHTGVRFPQKGNYGFELEQAMRTSDLKGISEIGIRIEKE